VLTHALNKETQGLELKTLGIGETLVLAQPVINPCSTHDNPCFKTRVEPPKISFEIESFLIVFSDYWLGCDRLHIRTNRNLRLEIHENSLNIGLASEHIGTITPMLQKSWILILGKC
jgi:hypothetical protein